MRGIRHHPMFRPAVALLLALSVITAAPVARAASHREAPLISLDPTADITDVYFFRSWENPDRAVLILNVIPSQVPASGPNFFNFDDTVLYAFHLDLNHDGSADDVNLEFAFTTEVRPPFDDLPVTSAGLTPVTALDGPGSAGLGVRQSYVVRLRDESGALLAEASTDKNGKRLFAVPSNVGGATMPNYEALAAQGVYDLGGGIRVFAGQRKESFYIDLGASFDTLNFRRNPPVLTNAEDANDAIQPFGVDDFQGLNVNTIAIEFPIASMPPQIGVYASTSRQQVTLIGAPVTAGRFVQVARMANPLVNELIIGTGFKDHWNATDPADEAQFLGFYQTPRLAAVLQAAFGIPIPATPRSDLVSVLLQYGSGSPGALSELLRLNLTLPPTPPAQQKRLTVLAHDAAGNATPDPAGWPNGRRPSDDVLDIAVRVVAGVLVPGPTAGFPHNRLGDGVNFNSGSPGTNVTANGIATKFPFLPTPIAGRQ